MMTEKMREKPEKKGEEQRKPLSQVRKSMRTSMASAVLASGIMGVSSREKLDISVPQKLVENNALVKTDELVTDVELSNLLEMEHSKGKFELIRDSEYGNPKVVATTQTENGDKVEFILEIISNKHEKKVSEILEDLDGAVSEDLIGRVELIEMAHRVSIITKDPTIVEGTIMVMLDRDVNHKEQYYSLVLDTLRPKNAIMPSQKRLFDESLRNSNFMSDDADWIKDDCF